MDYKAYLKKYENYDRYVLFLLSLGLNISEVARMAEVTRAYIYKVIKRNQKLVEDYGIALDKLMDTLEYESQGANDEPVSDS